MRNARCCSPSPICPDAPSRCSQRWLQVFAQALVAQTAIERFHKAILLWLTQGDIVPLDIDVLPLGEDGVTDQLGRIVADYHAWRRSTMAASSRTTRRPDSEVR